MARQNPYYAGKALGRSHDEVFVGREEILRALRRFVRGRHKAIAR